MNLTDRQRRFVEEYAIDCNAMQAAIRAGYTRKTAHKQGYALLRKPAIREAIRAVEHERLEILGVTADKVVTELARLAFSSVRRVVQWDDTGAMPLPSAQLSDDDAAAISEITCTPTDTGAHVRVKMHDKLKALEMLSRHLGVFKDGSGGVQQHLAAGATVNMHISYVGTAPSDGASGDRQ